MPRRTTATKHPAMLQNQLAATIASDELLRAHLMQYVEESLTRLVALMSSKSDAVALNAIKHLHSITGIGVPDGSTINQNMVNLNISPFMTQIAEKEGDPLIIPEHRQNGKIIDVKE